MDLVRQIKSMAEMVRNLPPVPSIVAVHSVPYGHVFRQWDTNGMLWVWMNRGELLEIPPVKQHEYIKLLGESSFGIPIYYSHPYWRNSEVQGSTEA